MEQVPSIGNGIEALAGWQFPYSLFERLPDLRWVQYATVGVEGIEGAPLPERVVATNARGLHSDAVAEYAIWALLTPSRRLHLALSEQTRRRWRPIPGTTLGGKAIGIVGLGAIGEIIATRARHRACGSSA